MSLSKTNKRFLEALEGLENVEVHNLIQMYPDFKIDVKKEQEALLKADKLVLQFPMFWFNSPAILKEWVDKVFEYGFAFDVTDKGYEPKALKDKEFMLSVSMGGAKEHYDEGVSVDTCLTPFFQTAHFCGLKVVKPYYVYAAMAQHLSEEDLTRYTQGFKEAVLQ